MRKTNALRLLDQAGVTYRTVVYTYDPEQLDVAKIAEDNGLQLAQVFKTLICKGDKTGPVVAIIAGDQHLSLKRLAQASGNKKMAMLGLKELLPTTGYQRGGCSPIGLKRPFPIYLDEVALQYEEILVNAGKRGLLFGSNPQDLIDTLAFHVVSLTE